jgi:Uri superfamily endonuclease
MLCIEIMGQIHRKTADNHFLSRNGGTYALILHCRHHQIINTGRLGKMSVEKGCYVYVGSAFGSGGVYARIEHHHRISKSFHWHIDYLRPVVEITEVWYSHDPIRREHQWAGIFMGTQGVKMPFKGFGSSDCTCDSHLFYFAAQPTAKMFRKQIEQAIPNHHRIEWMDGNAFAEDERFKFLK